MLCWTCWLGFAWLFCSLFAQYRLCFRTSFISSRASWPPSPLVVPLGVVVPAFYWKIVAEPRPALDIQFARLLLTRIERTRHCQRTTWWFCWSAAFWASPFGSDPGSGCSGACSRALPSAPVFGPSEWSSDRWFSGRSARWIEFFCAWLAEEGRCWNSGWRCSESGSCWIGCAGCDSCPASLHLSCCDSLDYGQNTAQRRLEMSLGTEVVVGLRFSGEVAGGVIILQFLSLHVKKY